MPTVAEQLRRAREEQRLSVAHVVEVTKMRTDQVLALEAGDYEIFTAPVFIRGFVRSYTTLLRLNVPEIMRLLDEELRRAGASGEEPRLLGRKQGPLDRVTFQLSRINWGLWIPLVVGVILIAGGLAGYQSWKKRRSTDPLGQLEPAQYQPSNPGAFLALPVPTNAPPRR